MTNETQTSGNGPALDELDGPLRRAVQQIRDTPTPDDAVTRTVARIERLNLQRKSTRAPATRSRPKRTRWPIWVAIGATPLVCVTLFMMAHFQESPSVPFMYPLDGQAPGSGLTANAAYTIPTGSNPPSALLGFDMAGTDKTYVHPLYPSLSRPNLLHLYDSTSTPDGGRIESIGSRTRETTAAITSKTRRARGKTVAYADVSKATAATAPVDPKRIIQTADVSLLVKDVTTIDAKLRALAKQFGGYAVDSQVTQPQGSKRTGIWVIRIPVDAFDKFVDAACELGNPENRLTNANDVGEEFVDLQARISSKKKLETRILGLLEKRTGKIEDVIAVENQLERIRTEIEQMEGRLKFLGRMTAMSTVTIRAREGEKYVAPKAPEPEPPPTFSERIDTTWGGSLGALEAFGKTLLLVTIAVTPWLPVVAGVVVPMVWLARRQKKAEAVAADKSDKPAG